MISMIFYSIALFVLFLVTGIPDAMDFGMIPTSNGAFFLIVGMAISAVCVYLGNAFDRSRR